MTRKRSSTVRKRLEGDFPEDMGYGLTTIIWQDSNLIAFGHTGFVPGYRSAMQYLPEFNYSVALQINSDDLPEDLGLSDCLNRINKIIIEYIKAHFSN